MTLKRQLLVASLLMLLIPWAGLQFVLELDDALRQQAREQLREHAQRLAKTVGDELIGQAPVTTDTPAIFVESIDREINLDGYANDWPGFEDGEPFQTWQTAGQPQQAGQPGLQWQAASDGLHLYLFVRVNNRQPERFNPASPQQSHDRLELWIEPPGDDVAQPAHRQSWLIRTTQPGEVYGLRGKQTDRPDYRILGVWPQTNKWELELRLPDPPEGSRLGFSARWPESDNVSGVSTSLDPLPVLVRRNRLLERKLEPRLNRGQHVRILEPGGWITARQNAPSSDSQPEFDQLSPLQVIERISLNALRALVQFYQPEPAPISSGINRLTIDTLPPEGLVRHEDGSAWLMTREPVFGGRQLILEQSLDQQLTLSGSALGSVIARSTLIIIGLTLVLLGYASWLSWRITRLQRAVSASIDEDGRITGTLPASRAQDELGQLQRHFSQMVDRLHGYNRYLESFSRRLSHELKTPVAVVRSSLENLSHSESDAEREQYIERAASATDRLRQILNGMSEAARLEQSFDHADKETFDLANVVAQATEAYQALDERHRIRYAGPPEGCTMTGSPELMVQLLDKLVDNARDFTPADGVIEVNLERTSNELCLSVFNQGSALPGTQATDIFGPFVSLRDGREEGHLGQGLLIVRLIADYHGARVEAANAVQGTIDGVRFRVIIPTANT
ncbi:histidine kinase [Marinobacter sediminum]|uniref:ATP-binding protein n=1 Tax=Marinobacter sediminum TaxID=256323 RepID=UPI0020306BFE|nr:ATP-binding protein [Marinobacter sediminum]MCM0613600.1 histidine kinase [Marinobacter sediminum]